MPKTVSCWAFCSLFLDVSVFPWFSRANLALCWALKPIGRRFLTFLRLPVPICVKFSFNRLFDPSKNPIADWRQILLCIRLPRLISRSFCPFHVFQWQFGSELKPSQGFQDYFEAVSRFLKAPSAILRDTYPFSWIPGIFDLSRASKANFGRLFALSRLFQGLFCPFPWLQAPSLLFRSF